MNFDKYAVGAACHSRHRQAEGAQLDHLSAQPLRCRDEQRRTAQQCHRIDAFPSIVLAHRAGVDVAGNAFAHKDGEFSVPAVQDFGERRAALRIGDGVACHQKRTEGLRNGLTPELAKQYARDGAKSARIKFEAEKAAA